MALGIGAEARQVDDGEFGHEAGELGLLGATQQRADEQRVPGQLGEDAGLDAEGRIGAAVQVLREQRHAFGVLEEVLVQGFELVGGDRLIATPPHCGLGGGVTHRELVLRAAAREHAGVGDQCALGGKHRLVVLQRMLVELRRAVVPVHALQILEAEFVGAMSTVMHARLLHE